jgi:hypothetical protein
MIVSITPISENLGEFTGGLRLRAVHETGLVSLIMFWAW